MGFWSSVKSGFKKIGEGVKEIYHAVKEKGKEICERVTERVQVWTDRAERAFDKAKTYVKEKIHEYKVKKKHPGYVPTKPDQVSAREAKRYLDNKFPHGIKESMKHTTSEGRVKAIKEVVTEASRILDVNINRVELFESTRETGNVCGFYNRNDNTLHINAYMLMNDRTELAQEQIYTVFHELIHARQWAAVTGKKDYGYSPETLLEWANNFNNYIPCTESDEAYRKQPLERDAFGFEAIIKGEFSIEDFIKYNSKK